MTTFSKIAINSRHIILLLIYRALHFSKAIFQHNKKLIVQKIINFVFKGKSKY